MLQDSFGDILAPPDPHPTLQAKRAAILRILPIYLHRSHGANDLYPDFHEQAGTQVGEHAAMADMGPRPPSGGEVLAGTAPASDQPQPSDRSTARPQHKHC